MHVPAPGPGQRPAPAEAAALAAAGRQFEALVIVQLLAAARPQGAGPEAEWRAIADRAMADQLAAASPLGIAGLLARTAAGKPSR